MASTETVNNRPEDIDFLDRFTTFAITILQNLDLEDLPFVETYFTIRAKIEGIRKVLEKKDYMIRIPIEISDHTEITIDRIPPEILEDVKKQLRLVKIPIFEIRRDHYVDSREPFYIIVVYKGK